MENILIVNGYLEIGGAERVLVYLANHLCKEYDVTFALLQESKCDLFHIDDRVRLIPLELEKKRLSAKEMGVRGTIKYYTFTANKLKELANELKTDLVIAFNDREVFLTWFAFHNNPNIKLLFSQRNSPYSKPWWTNLFLAYVYHHCNAVVFQLEQVRKFYKMDKIDNCEVIENPVKLPGLFEYNENREKVILGIGRLTKQKRFDLLINAFVRFHKKHSDYRLVIYGDGVERQSLQKMITDYGLEDSIQLHKAISNVAEKNKMAEFFVLSSDYEGIPNVLIEAMAVGIPCISTDCVPGGGALITDRGRCAILVKRNSVDDLYNAMEQYYCDKKLQEHNAKRAYEYLEKFDENTILGKWDMLIKKCIN